MIFLSLHCLSSDLWIYGITTEACISSAIVKLNAQDESPQKNISKISQEMCTKRDVLCRLRTKANKLTGITIDPMQVAQIMGP